MIISSLNKIKIPGFILREGEKLGDRETEREEEEEEEERKREERKERRKRGRERGRLFFLRVEYQLISK